MSEPRFPREHYLDGYRDGTKDTVSSFEPAYNELKQRYEQLERVVREMYALSESLLEVIADVADEDDAQSRGFAALGATSAAGHIMEHAELQLKELGVKLGDTRSIRGEHR